ncbi:Zonadhesin [Eumeta japonica]|uniref:Zonadhesin n=1 Tax=Eumeta variegata TaxID=151549 RepID=A0A4C1UV03_EUMVA|nr:Zonadhesin [Eumeta japonica]
MESPVRICLSIIVVVHLLLLSSVPARSNAIPLRNGTAEASKDKIKISRFSRFNNATLAKPNVEDVALNELKPKETGSSEETDPKSSKYKDRGRIKFHSYLTSTTETPIKRIVKPTPETKVIIVTPTPEQKNLSQIIDSMREYKKTKIPPLVVSSTTPTTVDLKESSSDEDDMYEDDEEFSKFVSGNFHDSNFFTIPGFTDDEFSQGSKANDNYNKDYSVPPYEKFSSYFPKDMSYSPKRDKYESDSFFRDFEDALTTPKNDFFDKKFHEITSSILNNLNSIRAQTPEPNATSVHKIVKENVGLERLLSNGSPNNKSMVIIKNTKEVRLLDDDKAGSAQKELSDVHGTSIYYEMSVLSTETYTIHNDDDCDNDTLPFEPTKSTSFEEEKASLKSTAPALLPLESKPVFVSSTPSPQILTTSVSSTGSPLKNDVEFISTYHTTPKVSSFTIRQRGYPKSINFPSKKETSNSVTVRNDELSSNRNIKPVNNRRIQFTTPRNKPVWMAPRRNITRPKPNRPTTIYSEYFNIKDKFNSKLPNRTSVLTTASSDIDPVFQSDVVGSKKVVHSQSISDNSIPGLRKRGSAKFSTSATSTQNSTEEEDSTRNMEIPPSSAAWALAGMRNPPSLTSTLADRTIPVRKPDENELQNVAEETVSEKIKTTPDVATPTNGDSNTEVTSKKIYEMDQNKLPWRPVTTPSSAIVESDTKQSVTASKIESYPAESNVSVHGSSMQIEKSTTGVAIAEDTTTTSATKDTTTTPEWVPVTSEEFDRVTTNDKEISSNHIHPLTTNNASAFESITKLPSDLTTPQSDDISSFTVGLSTQKVFDNTVTLPSTMPIDIGDEITTIRFSYVPTVKEVITKVTEFTETTPTWHPVKPSHTRTTYVPEDNTPITTYRPKYVTTTEKMEETTNVSKYPTSADKDEETTTTIQESSSPQQLVSNSETQVTTFQTNVSSFTEDTTSATEIVTEISVESTPNPEETTTIIVEVVTEINTERETPMKFGKSTLSTSQETTVEDISTEADFITLSSSEISEQSSSSNEFMTESNEQKFSEFVHKFTTPFRFETTMEQKYDDTTTRRLETTTMPTIKPTEPIKQQTTIEEERTKPMMPPTEATKSIPKVTTDKEEYIDTPEEEITTRSVTNLDDMLSYGEQTTEASTIFIEDAGSGAPVAIAVSTIGVLALMMLVGLLLTKHTKRRSGSRVHDTEKHKSWECIKD